MSTGLITLACLLAVGPFLPIALPSPAQMMDTPWRSPLARVRIIQQPTILIFFQTCFSVSSSCVAFGEGQALCVCYSLPVHGYQNGRGWCQGCKVATSYWGSEPLYSYAPRDRGPRWEAGTATLQLGRWEGQQVFRKCPEIHLTLYDAHQPHDSQVPSVRLLPAR